MRLEVMRAAAVSAGAALMRLPRGVKAKEVGDQLKTAADAAVEAWVLAYLRAYFPDDRYLAEEDFEASAARTGNAEWDAPRAYWTVDALDGTRSFADGFDGFCVQIAWVEDGLVRAGVVYEPALDQLYFAERGQGAFRSRGDETVRLSAHAWRERPRFVDSTRPKEVAGRWFAQSGAEFVELGSIGLKICRVADGSADVFAKVLRFKLWDVAPGALILEEAGGRLGVWGGEAVPFDTKTVHYQNILATHASRFDDVVRGLKTP
jgi:3'(2'), 5'-bisphosphate nucleotidase